MRKLEFEASKKTPKVLLDESEGLLELIGRSSPNDSFSFYSQILDEIKTLTPPENKLTANFNLEYFNTSSSRCIYVLMKELKGLNDKGCTVNVNWHYEEDDEDIKEVGEDFAEILDWEFNYVEVK